MKTVTLGKRLSAIAALVSSKTLLDVGSDHGKLPCFLLQTGKIQSAVLTDINPLPLEKAKNKAASFGLLPKTSFYLANGLDLPENVLSACDTIVIAGMGGELIAEILSSENRRFLAGKQLILQPMSKPEELRAVLFRLGFEIKGETVLFENGKYCVIVEAVYNDKPYHADIYTGKLNPRDPAARDYITKRLHAAEKSLLNLKNAAGDVTSAVKQLKSARDSYKAFLEVKDENK